MALEVMPSAKAQIQLSEPIIVTPAQTLWSSDFQVWPSALFTTVLKAWTNTGVNNSNGAEWDRSAGAGTEAVGNLIGLTIGRSYTLRLVAKVNTAGPTFAINAGGVTSTPTALTTAYAPYSVTFTASSVSHTLSFITNAAAKVYLDNISLDANPVYSSTTNLPVAEGDLSLDRSRVPYGVSRITVPSSDPSLPESLKPLARQRVKVTAQAQGRWGNAEPTYSSWARIRQNTFFDPRGTSLGSDVWSNSGFTQSLRTDMPNPTPTAVRFTRASTSSARVSIIVGSGFPTFQTGIRLLATVRASEAMAGVQVYSRPTSASATGQVLLTTINIPAGVSEIDVTGVPHVASANTSTSGISLVFPTVSATGATLDITRVMIERKPDTLPALYFDGGTLSSNPLVSYTWDGAGTAPRQMSSMLTRTVVAPGAPLWLPSDTRTFDMAMLSREVSHDGRSVDIELATDEALLMNYSTLTDDYEPMNRQDSLRSVINYVLNKAIPGAALEAGGAADRPFKVLADATNMIIDPRYARTPNNGYGAANVTTLVDTSWVGTENLWGVHLYNPVSTDGFFELRNADMAYGMQPGRSYTFSATGSVRGAMGGSERVERARRLVVVALLPSGYVDLAISPQISTTVMADTRVSVSFTVPTNASQVWVRAYHGHTQGTLSWRAFRLSESHKYSGPHNYDYFDGVRPNTSEYAHSWTGAADNSTSRRISLIERSPELLVWRAGDSAWDFLETLKNAAGLRLFCDENRKWRLVNSADFQVPGRISVRANNAIEGSDVVDAGGTTAAQGVIARFNWRDADGNQRTKDDVAGSPGRALLIEFDRPYPGPGTAAAILTRRAGQGRTQDVTVLSDLNATPGQEISITLPGTVNQLGTLQSAQFDLAEGTMRLESTGLTEVTPGSWLAEDPATTWNTTPDTRTWGNS